MTQSYQEYFLNVFGGIEQDKETPLWSIQTAPLCDPLDKQWLW